MNLNSLILTGAYNSTSITEVSKAKTKIKKLIVLHAHKNISEPTIIIILNTMHRLKKQSEPEVSRGDTAHVLFY